jgi:hypothetical protein
MQYKTFVRNIAMLAFASMPILAAAADGQSGSVTGNWKITAALDGADITSRDEREARQLIGRTLVISREEVRFGKRVCGPSTYDSMSVEPRLFLRNEFHASAERLALPNPVTVVELSCTSVFIKGKDRLVVAWDGWFFDAVRVKR